MMRVNEDLAAAVEPMTTMAGRARAALLVVLAVIMSLALLGCSGGDDTATEDDAPQVSYGMAGAPKDVIVSREAIESTPTAPVLDTPESAVRSYLDWISYGYRTAQPAFAEPTMSEYEVVRIDAYNEYNIQKDRLIDQSLISLTFSDEDIQGSTATIATSERWAYRYVSTTEPGKTIDGPHEAEFENVYSLILTDAGWVVDRVRLGSVGESE